MKPKHSASVTHTDLAFAAQMTPASAIVVSFTFLLHQN